MNTFPPVLCKERSVRWVTPSVARAIRCSVPRETAPGRPETCRREWERRDRPCLGGAGRSRPSVRRSTAHSAALPAGPVAWLVIARALALLPGTRGKEALLRRVENPGAIKVVVGSSAGLDIDGLLATTTDSATTFVDRVDPELSCRALEIKRCAADKLFMSSGATNASQDECNHESLTSHVVIVEASAACGQHAIPTRHGFARPAVKPRAGPRPTGIERSQRGMVRRYIGNRNVPLLPAF